MSKSFFSLTVLLFLLQGCSILKKPVRAYQPDMVSIKGGTFLLGDFYDGENTDAIPLHEVIVTSFSIGRYEVTFKEYDMFAVLTNRDIPEDDGYGRGRRSVVYVTWDDAEAFCKSLGFRLPTEIEWEYAARSGGKESLFSGTSNPDSLKEFAITRDSNINFSYSTGSRKPNELGLYDMSGNVFEWIGEFYQFYRTPDTFNKLENTGIRIIRGGSFTQTDMVSRTYWRAGTLHDVQSNDIGFRCAK